MRFPAATVLILLALGCSHPSGPFGTWQAVTILDENGVKTDNSDFGLAWYPMTWIIRPDSTYEIEAEGPLADSGSVEISTNRMTFRSVYRKPHETFSYTLQGNMLKLATSNHVIVLKKR